MVGAYVRLCTFRNQGENWGTIPREQIVEAHGRNLKIEWGKRGPEKGRCRIGMNEVD
jgi:hypothetical protein